jgi:DNA segregation ATPase FtsK/SpoIIIE-like protein
MLRQAAVLGLDEEGVPLLLRLASSEVGHVLVAGIHLMVCTQKPSVDAIGCLVHSNFPLRLVGSEASPEDAKVDSGPVVNSMVDPLFYHINLKVRT